MIGMDMATQPIFVVIFHIEQKVLFFHFVLFEAGSLCRPDCPETRDQADLKLIESCLPDAEVKVVYHRDQVSLKSNINAS